MGSIPFAFSVHHFINSVGADAGFASIIGLAILVLLYFAQARETASLREQAYEWAQRVQHLEARIAELTRQRQAPAPQPAVAVAPSPVARPVVGALAGTAAARSTAAPVPAGVGAVAQARVAAPALVGAGVTAPAAPVGAPAGVAAPALTAATKLIPTGAPADDALQLPEVDLTAIEAPPPATVAGGANGHAHEPVPAVPPPSPAAAQPPPSRAAAPPPPPPRIQIGSPGTGAPRRPMPPLRAQPPQASSRGRRLVVALLVLVAIGVVVGALLILTKSSNNNTTATSGSVTSNAPATASHKSKPKAKAKSPAVTPSSVSVAVLNGTATSGLASRVSDKLVRDGYKQGATPTNAADQTHTGSIVAYLPGNKADATAVATSLGLPPSSVQAIDAQTQQLVCHGVTPCPAAVVVTVGTDLQNTQ